MGKFAGKTRAVLVVGATLLGLGAAVFVAPGPALAITSEENQAVAAAEPSDRSQKVTVAGSTAYFVDNGDTWYVNDTAADGASAAVLWENYRGNTVIRVGVCYNQLGNRSWGSCNKNYDESTRIRAKACTYDFSEGRPGACSGWKYVKG